MLTANPFTNLLFLSERDLRDSLVRRYPDIAEQLQYISCKVDQLTSAEKEELRPAGKEVPPTPEIPDSDNEDENDDEETSNPIAEQEPECIDLTTGGDDAPNNPPVNPDPAKEEMKKKLAV